MLETTLSQLTDHVYWMSPGKPDRPALCAVVGTNHTLVIDTGASEAHALLFLTALQEAGVPAPSLAVLTHWHWDHIFGATTLNVPILAHRETAKQVAVLAGYTWDDAALDQRVVTGEEIASCAADIKQELPEPRAIPLVLPTIVFDDALNLDLGGVTCRIQHVGGDHAADSCVVHISPDRVLVLGDCLYEANYTPPRHYTPEKLLPLIDTLLAFEADHFVEGHSPTVLSRPELGVLIQKMHYASSLAERFGTNEAGALAGVEIPDEDTEDFVRSFIAGNRLRQESQLAP